MLVALVFLLINYIRVLVHQQVHAPFVCIDQLPDLVQVRNLQVVHFLLFLVGHARLVLHDHQALLDPGRDRSVHNQFRHQFVGFSSLKAKLALDVNEREGLVLELAFNHVDLHCDFLEPLQQLALEFTSREFLHFGKELELRDTAKGFLPLALVEVSGGCNDVVSVACGHELHSLLVVHFDQFSEVAADHLFGDVESVQADVWHFKHHRSRHVHAVQLFQIHLQVWWHVPLLFFNLFFQRFLMLSSCRPLSQTFS